MTNIINLKVKRTAQACGCGSCGHQDFSIVDDFTEGFIVVCDNCGSVNGQLLVDNKMNGERE